MAEKYTAQQMIDAVQDAKGILAAAARQLGCSRTTLYNYMERYSTVKDAYIDARESLIDFTEQQLFKQVSEGNITAIIFTLKTIGKRRGYVERQEVTGANGGELVINVTLKDDA